jgi:hypothetical protein
VKSWQLVERFGAGSGNKPVLKRRRQSKVPASHKSFTDLARSISTPVGAPLTVLNLLTGKAESRSRDHTSWSKPGNRVALAVLAPCWAARDVQSGLFALDGGG